MILYYKTQHPFHILQNYYWVPQPEHANTIHCSNSFFLAHGPKLFDFIARLG